MVNNEKEVQNGSSSLTLWRPVGFDDFREKKHKRMWPCAGIFPVSATNLVKGPKDLASLLVCTRKKFFAWGIWIFCEWRKN